MKILQKTIFIILLIGFFQQVFAAQVDPNEILRDINAYRAKQGLSKLKMNSVIVVEAKKHSLDMADNVVPFGHKLFNERMKTLFRQLKHSHAIAENVAYISGHGSADELVSMWLHSSGHRRNIEGNYNLTGIGIVQDKDGGIYATQIFIRAG